MNLASLELRKELYELSGWKDDGSMYGVWPFRPRFVHGDAPDYTLGYLRRTLPQLKDIDFRIEQDGGNDNGPCWVAYGEDYADHRLEESRRWWSPADTPENAACKLAIELFKQGVLK